MLQVRRQIVPAIGLLVMAMSTSAVLAHPKQNDGRQRAVTERPAQRVAAVPARTGDIARKPQDHRWTLPGFRVPPEKMRDVGTPQVPPARRAERTPASRTASPSRRVVSRAPSRRAVEHARAPRRGEHKPAAKHARKSASRTVHHAHYAVVDAHAHRSRSSALVAEARRWLGTNPTGRARLWCARFMNFVLERTGYAGTGSDAAKSFAYYGHRISKPQYGAIAVLTRKGGGHVGIVTGVDRRGNPILIAGNNGRRQVGISVYPKRRVIAYVMPDADDVLKSRRFASAKSARTR
jgi:uncharacterized protein (TIGR02594 family)